MWPAMLASDWLSPGAACGKLSSTHSTTVTVKMIVPARRRNTQARCHRPIARSRSGGHWYLGSSMMKPEAVPLVSWDELRPVLAEAAGGVALQEVVLDRLLARECERRGIRITEADLATERQALTDTLVRDAGASAADAERLLERIRRQRGLGDARFAAL